jgi:hypothetical protein
MAIRVGNDQVFPGSEPPTRSRRSIVPTHVSGTRDRAGRCSSTGTPCGPGGSVAE